MSNKFLIAAALAALAATPLLAQSAPQTAQPTRVRSAVSGSSVATVEVVGGAAPVGAGPVARARVVAPGGAAVAQSDSAMVFNNSLTYRILRTGADQKISLDIENKPVKEALEDVLKSAKREFSIEGELAEARVTLKLKDVRLSSVLDTLTDAAGVSWVHEVRNNTERIRISKQAGRSLWTVASPFGGTGVPAPPGVSTFVSGAPFLYSMQTAVTRVNFSCPHCKNHVSYTRREEPVKCAKCSRELQPKWMFCPVDGAKRPESGNEWQYCPVCGKRVQISKSATTTESGPARFDPHGQAGEDRVFEIFVDPARPVPPPPPARRAR